MQVSFNGRFILYCKNYLQLFYEYLKMKTYQRYSIFIIFSLCLVYLILPNFWSINKYFSNLNPWHQTPQNSYKKYVLYECNTRQLCGGLVDRFKAIMNVYAWSLFTNRILIVNISKPCYFERLLMPNDVNWNLNLTNLVETQLLPQNYSLHELRKLDNMGFKNELAKLNVLNYHKDVDVLSLYTNIEWISAYARNKYFFI